MIDLKRGSTIPYIGRKWIVEDFSLNEDHVVLRDEITGELIAVEFHDLVEYLKKLPGTPAWLKKLLNNEKALEAAKKRKQIIMELLNGSNRGKRGNFGCLLFLKIRGGEG